jgi:hypothetical protein
MHRYFVGLLHVSVPNFERLSSAIRHLLSDEVLKKKVKIAHQPSCFMF